MIERNYEGSNANGNYAGSIAFATDGNNPLNSGYAYSNAALGVFQTYTEASHGHGFVTEEIPELSIAVIASRRLAGIGRRLLVDLINASDSQGYQALSLSVREANPARRLYESVGFVPVETHGSSWKMVRYAGRER